MTLVQQLRTRVLFALSTLDRVALTVETSRTHGLVESIIGSLTTANILIELLEEEFKNEE